MAYERMKVFGDADCDIIPSLHAHFTDTKRLEDKQMPDLQTVLQCSLLDYLAAPLEDCCLVGCKYTFNVFVLVITSCK